jgi:hypothetical protein
MNRIIKRLAVPLSAAAVLGTAGFAYMASNQTATSYAGSGDTTVSGYQVSPIHFITTPAAGGDAYLLGITFSLDHSADPANVGAYVYYNYQHQVSRWTNCTATNAPTDTAFKCVPTSPNYGTSTDNNGASVTVSGISKITVTAAQ